MTGPEHDMEPESVPSGNVSPVDESEADDEIRSDTSDAVSAQDSDNASPEVRQEAEVGERKNSCNSKSYHKVLPAEILESILYIVDPETFASLILVDRAWRQAAQTPHLYAHHLSRCPSFSLNHNVVDAGPFTDESLPQLKRKFAQEVKRNLFEAYLQPRRTVISLIGTTASSSAAVPAGEAFDFIFSANGHWTLALSSSRIYVVDTVAPQISVKRELKIQRRPVSAAILDDASILAVLSSNQHAYVYSLAEETAKHLRSISLDNRAHGMALSPGGDVLATAFDGGLEIHSLSPNSTDADRRIIKCDRVDSLSFSPDSTVLIGTTRHSKNPNTVILTAPYLSDDNLELPPGERISHMWTTQIVFPNSTRDCSHAALIPNRADADANWTFTYDRVFESFRAVRTDDLRNGTTYFTGPRRPPRETPGRSRRKLIPCTLPTANQEGDLVAAAFSGKDVWLYGLPEGLDHCQGDELVSGSGIPRTPSGSSARSMTRGQASELHRLPKWQILVDRYRNVFAKGRRVAEIPGVSTISWVADESGKPGRSNLKERLIVAAPGGVTGDPGLEQDDFAAPDGGRLIILDFDRTPVDGKIESMTIEVGLIKPENLEEESRDLETEVAMARSRTVRRDRVDRRTVIDALSSHHPPGIPAIPSQGRSWDKETDLADAPIVPTPDVAQDGMTLQEATHAFEGPYSHTNPRSRESIYRSATAVAANRERNPRRIMPERPVELRRPGARGELPHESDADNWVPPPPPYAPNPDSPLPEQIRRTLLPGQDEPLHRPPVGRIRGPRRSSTTYESSTSQHPRRISSLPEGYVDQSIRPSITRALSDDRASRSPPVSPISTGGLSIPEAASEVSDTSRRPSQSPSRRRPVSEYLGRVTGSIRRPKSSSRQFTIDSAPPVPRIPRSFTSPIPSNSGTATPLSHNASMIDLQDYANGSPITMPSSEQLANLSSRSRRPPPQQVLASARNARRSELSPGSIVPTPPRGALGAAGNSGPTIAAASQQGHGAADPLRFSSAAQLRSLSTLHNSSARSSPALLRPAPKRLDTIDSVSSFLSRTRSRSRDITSRGSIAGPSIQDGTPKESVTLAPGVPLIAIPAANDTLARRRSQSAGPALKLDRVQLPPQTPGERSGKRSVFGVASSGKARRVKSGNQTPVDFSDSATPTGRDKGNKCVVM